MPTLIGVSLHPVFNLHHNSRWSESGDVDALRAYLDREKSGYCWVLYIIGTPTLDECDAIRSLYDVSRVNDDGGVPLSAETSRDEWHWSYRCTVLVELHGCTLDTARLERLAFYAATLRYDVLGVYVDPSFGDLSHFSAICECTIDTGLFSRARAATLACSTADVEASTLALIQNATRANAHVSKTPCKLYFYNPLAVTLATFRAASTFATAHATITNSRLRFTALIDAPPYRDDASTRVAHLATCIRAALVYHDAHNDPIRAPLQRAIGAEAMSVLRRFEARSDLMDTYRTHCDVAHVGLKIFISHHKWSDAFTLTRHNVPMTNEAAFWQHLIVENFRKDNGDDDDDPHFLIPHSSIALEVTFNVSVESQ